MTALRRHAAILAIALLPLATSVGAGGAIAIPMTADRWQTKENAEFLRQLGFYRGLLRLNSGNAVLKGLTDSKACREVVHRLLQQTNLFDARKKAL